MVWVRPSTCHARFSLPVLNLGVSGVSRTPISYLLPYGPLGHGEGVMNRRAIGSRMGGIGHWAAPLVLVMLCLRALVPAGFMLASVNGRPAVVLCDSMAAPGGTHEHVGHHHPGHAHLDPTCPFAQSSGPAPPPAMIDPTDARWVPQRDTPLVEQSLVLAEPPARYTAPRGPPPLT